MAEEASPQQQQVHIIALSEFVVFSFSERDKKVESVPCPTGKGTDVLLSKISWNGPCY